MLSAALASRTTAVAAKPGIRSRDLRLLDGLRRVAIGRDELGVVVHTVEDREHVLQEGHLRGKPTAARLRALRR